MKRYEIIRTTLSEMNCPPDYVEIAIAELGRRLPDTEFRVCGDFLTPTADCCESCHTFYPHYDMKLIELPDRVSGWVCCAVERQLASTPPI
ncbi:hypothetical protein Terro_3199 [Terriglobus roseus DSM 18391]|uniref:Uncharacterized protein n=1 Tax=Terriglobus roseus (strain DSM 18391 / NRRL B-41598 / KBS 63) TaxID=926566 RepID=I3ZJK2_TERRK|nr:hypothetical protein [Terriglobus roseus]AFL89420.1 hypothetical protein Terro_3199 [Terriglobus roseus DSM 18391]